jgi:hypothetical protein
MAEEVEKKYENKKQGLRNLANILKLSKYGLKEQGSRHLKKVKVLKYSLRVLDTIDFRKKYKA